MTDDLAGFLLARIADDEAASREAAELIAGWRHPELSGWAGFAQVHGWVTFRRSAAEHIARWDPARVLAECEAKRRIVALHQPLRQAGYVDCATCREPYEGEADPWPCDTLRAFAVPYADHPDYRQEWTP